MRKMAQASARVADTGLILDDPGKVDFPFQEGPAPEQHGEERTVPIDPKVTDS